MLCFICLVVMNIFGLGKWFVVWCVEVMGIEFEVIIVYGIDKLFSCFSNDIVFGRVVILLVLLVLMCFKVKNFV